MLASKRIQLQKDIQKAPLTPIDMVYEQHEKHRLVYDDMQSIRGEEWDRLESGTDLPSMTAQLLDKVQRIQNCWVSGVQLSYGQKFRNLRVR